MSRAAADDASSHDGHAPDEGWSGAETAHASPSRGPRKRRRQKHQKTSCELCKARKVKCDRAEPACSWCARHNRECVYLERQKPGSRIEFGLELEARVNRIDGLLQALEQRLEGHISQDHKHYHRPQPAPPPSPSHLPPSYPPPTPTPTASTSASASAAVPPTPRPYLATAQQHTSAELWSSTAAWQSPPSVANSPGLPPPEVLHSLVDLYFKHCNTWCPILDRKTTFETFFGPAHLDEAGRVLLHAIVATTLRFYHDERMPPEAKRHHHAESKKLVQLYALENVSVAALRALVILCLDELGTSNGPRAWNLLSLLAQQVRQLNLGEETSVFLRAEAAETPRTGSVRRVACGQPPSWIEDEGRRRLCWMVFVLDRYATIATTTFDFLLDDSRVCRVLPCSYDLFSRGVPVETRALGQDPVGATRSSSHSGPAVDECAPPEPLPLDKPENLGSFSYHCEILRILGRVHDFLKAPVDIHSTADMAAWRNHYRHFDMALDAWLQSLPGEYGRISSLCHSDPASRVANWFMLHSAFVVAVVRLHSPAAYPTVCSQLLVPSHYARQRCLSAVQSLRSIVQDVCEASALDLLGPFFAFAMWVAARLLLLHAAAAESALDASVDVFIDKLERIGRNWEVAHNYAKILTRVVQRGRAGDMTFAAMRKSAQDLVTLASSTRRSGGEPTSTQVTTLSEFDNIDVFDFFNYPNPSQDVPGLRRTM